MLLENVKWLTMYFYCRSLACRFFHPNIHPDVTLATDLNLPCLTNP